MSTCLLFFLFLDLWPYLEWGGGGGGRQGNCPSDIYDILQNSEQKKLANWFILWHACQESHITSIYSAMFILTPTSCDCDEAACAPSYCMNTLGSKGAQHDLFVFPL